MDFESPDVEKDFPGLYASESGRKSNESDCKYHYWNIYYVIYAIDYIRSKNICHADSIRLFPYVY